MAETEIGKRPSLPRFKKGKDRGTVFEKIMLRERCRVYDARNVGILADIAADEAQPAAARISAINILLERGHGRPAQSVDVTGGGTVAIQIITNAAIGVITDGPSAIGTDDCVEITGVCEGGD